MLSVVAAHHGVGFLAVVRCQDAVAQLDLAAGHWQRNRGDFNLCDPSARIEPDFLSSGERERTSLKGSNNL